MWQKDVVKAAVEGKDASCRELLEARDEVAKERCMEAYKTEKRKIKRCIYQSKKEVNKQLGRKMNQDVSENRSCCFGSR